MASLATLVLPPEFTERSYQAYKKNLEIWKLLKTCTAKEQGPIVVTSLPNNSKAKAAALELSPEVIGADDGLKRVLEKLDKLYDTDNNHKICSDLERFENIKRLPHMNMRSFICEFERLHNDLSAHGIIYPDGVLAWRVMKASNISKEHETLCRATVETDRWSYKSVIAQLRKIFPDAPTGTSKVESSSSSLEVPNRPIKLEKLEDTYFSRNDTTQDCYFGKSNHESDHIYYHDFNEDADYDIADNSWLMQPNVQGYREPEEYDVYYGPTNKSNWKWNSKRPNNQIPRGRNYQGFRRSIPEQQNSRAFQRNGDSVGSSNSKQNPYSMNPKDYRGNPTVCRKCRSIYHWWENCPHVTPQERKLKKTKSTV